ncbi:hypothetical protein MLD38_026289 [Melastoma candidum]|uniref:Uncharacterized protein n=1 Tax=Melastoma candidum TaxID=119954 RepID=A0ACB9NY01_9MYRT|nr:hypothetical protein MLD38_026289 [Melastoma candidum]
MVPNEIIDDIPVNQSLADHWVHSNVRPFYPETKIRYLLVSNEVISSTGNKTWLNLVPAMRRIKKSLKAYRIRKVKVGTSIAMDVLASSYLPSVGKFRPDIAVMRPMLEFLNHTKSYLFLDVYPYFTWAAEPDHIDLNCTLFASHNITVTDPGTGLVYHNLFAQMVDTVIFASSKLGYPDVRIWIAETGRPNAGDCDQRGANIYNAAMYNRNAVGKLTTHLPRGTPAGPGPPLVHIRAVQRGPETRAGDREAFQGAVPERDERVRHRPERGDDGGGVREEATAEAVEGRGVQWEDMVGGGGAGGGVK